MAGTPQAQASDPRRSAWAEANAGSGKTHVLVERLLRLLLLGAPPQRILCLTYTRAAATEMSARLHRALSAWIAAPDQDLAADLARLGEAHAAPEDLAAARRLFARVLETPGGLKIQTIHAFCERLLRQFPIEAGLPPGFSVLEEARAQALREEALARVLADPDPGLESARTHLSRHTEGEEFAAWVRAVSARLNELDLGPASTARLARALGLGPHDSAEAIDREMLSLGPGDFAAAAEVLAAGKLQTERDTAARIVACLAAAGSELTAAAVAELFLTAAGAPKKLSTLIPKSTAARLPWVHDLIASAQRRYLALRDRRHAIETLMATRSLTILAAHVGALYEEAKLRASAFDFDDLIIRAERLLSSAGAASFVLYKLDGGIDHLLLDEAQDTSPAQWRIIQALTGEFFSGEAARPPGRTVFAVGDRKQSIFSFQGADPESLDASRRHFERAAAAAGRPLAIARLTVSYRSAHGVLAAVDSTFAAPAASRGVLPPGDTATVHEPLDDALDGHVEIWPLIAGDSAPERLAWQPPAAAPVENDRNRKLAQAIAARVAGWLAERRPLALKDGVRPVTPGDILILLRKRGALADALIRALTAQGIPVAGADRLSLPRHPAVADLLTLARAVLLPDDDLSLAELLKSPLCRREDGEPFGETELFDLAHGRGDATLWSRLVERHPAIATEIAGWRAMAGVLAPYDFFARVLTCGEPSGRARLASRLGPAIADPLEAFLDQALDFESQGVVALAQFLDWFAAAGAEIKRDMEHGRDEVRIMTVHGAKGLEANIVFLADTASLPTSIVTERVRILRPAGEPPLVVLKPKQDQVPAALDALLEPDREAKRAEYRRLLYVAMTRAREELHVCGTGSREAPGSWYDLVRLPSAPRTMPRPPRPSTRPAPTARPPASAVPPLRAFAPLAQASGLRPVPDRPPVDADIQETRRDRLIHRLFQSFCGLTEAECRPRALALCRRQGFGVAEADAVLRLITLPTLAGFLGPDSRADATVGGRLPDGRRLTLGIDRLAVSAREVRFLALKAGASRALEPAESGVLADQARLLGLAFPALSVRGAILWTGDAVLTKLPLADEGLSPR